jgi:hypothetical protein
MIRLDVDGYWRLSIGARRLVDDWLEASGLRPTRVVEVTVEDEGGRSVLVRCLAGDPDTGSLLVRDGEPVTELRRVEVTDPFPVEVLAPPM